MKGLSRREFLKLSLAAGGAAVLNACKPKETTAPTVAAAELDLPFEIAEDAINPLGMPEPVTAEGVFFSGGFGLTTGLGFGFAVATGFGLDTTGFVCAAGCGLGVSAGDVSKLRSSSG